MTGVWNTLSQTPKWMLIATVRLYQIAISPLLGKRCRFEPSCSRYFIVSVEKYGVCRGALRGVGRLCRCHPWHPGGYDPP
ncbi:MAG TPA: membrane protein insertion efficiency factor YidD [Pirellulales bacterium]|nr:membrane protein insertion efficiency factor YidD [Pirellulales bacterium]